MTANRNHAIDAVGVGMQPGKGTAWAIYELPRPHVDDETPTEGK